MAFSELVQFITTQPPLSSGKWTAVSSVYEAFHLCQTRLKSRWQLELRFVFGHISFVVKHVTFLTTYCPKVVRTWSIGSTSVIKCPNLAFVSPVKQRIIFTPYMVSNVPEPNKLAYKRSCLTANCLKLMATTKIMLFRWNIKKLFLVQGSTNVHICSKIELFLRKKAEIILA